MGISVYVSCFFFVHLFKFSASEFEYSYSSPNGPRRWPAQYPQCGGNKQSPINIQTKQAVEAEYGPMRICFGKSELKAASLKNNGHTVDITFPGGIKEQPVIARGPLGNESYSLESIHFHWGEHDRVGSETTINSKRTTMEMHAIFLNRRFNSIQEAIETGDPKALTVFAVFVDASLLNSDKFFNFAKNIPYFEQYNSEIKYDFDSFPLSKLLPTDGGFYAYEGSLTTPPCSEIVTWIVLRSRLQISHELMLRFRTVRTSRGEFIPRNYRPVNRLNGRIVYSKPFEAFIEICR